MHRLIYEDNFGPIPEGYDVHHKDGNKINNCITNLELIPHNEHASGENHPMYGKNHSEDSCFNMSKSRNTSGYFRVCKHKNKMYKQGFIYSYKYYENGKRKQIDSISLKKLEEKVKNKNLPWRKIHAPTK